MRAKGDRPILEVSIIGNRTPSLPSPDGRGFCPLSFWGRAREGELGNSVMYFGKFDNIIIIGFGLLLTTPHWP